MHYLKPFSLPLGLLVVVLLLQVHVKSIRSEQGESVYQAPTIDDFKKTLDLEDVVNTGDMSDQFAVSDDELLVQLAPLLASRSVERVATFLKNDALSLSQRLRLLDKIIGNPAYGFFDEDAIQLILDIANEYKPGSEDQEQLFGVLLKHKKLLNKTSPLFIAIENDYTHTYLPLLAWAVKNAATNPAVQKELLELKMRALKHAIDLGKADILDKAEKFTAKGITPQEATDLVWYIAQSGSHPELLKKIKEFGADINEGRGKETPLIAAVESGKKDVVQQLIDIGVDLNRIVDPEYGTALQRAFAQRNAEIEEILRKAGARE